MEGIDLVIVAFALVLAVVGWRQGFVVGVLSLAGFAAGAYGGTRLAPLVLDDGSKDPYAPLFGLGGALMLGTFAAGIAEGLGAGVRRRLWRVPGAGWIDGTLGAILLTGVALGIAWVAGAVALQAPGGTSLRRDIQRSEILSRLNRVLPPSGPLLNAIARFDPFPTLDGPTPEVAAPRAAIAREAGVRAAAGSVVRVLGTACGLGVEGSGWVAAPGVVVTNAHVVAGQKDTVVQLRGDGPRLDAEALAFEVRNDIAVLRVSGLDAPALPFAPDTASGRGGAVLGFPRNGPYDVRAARLGATSKVLTQDAYGDGPVRRSVTTFRGLVRPGNSGGPIVSSSGQVLATVFAATRGSGPRGGYAVPNAVVRRVLARTRGGAVVGTGPCGG